MELIWKTAGSESVAEPLLEGKREAHSGPSCWASVLPRDSLALALHTSALPSVLKQRK